MEHTSQRAGALVAQAWPVVLLLLPWVSPSSTRTDTVYQVWHICCLICLVLYSLLSSFIHLPIRLLLCSFIRQMFTECFLCLTLCHCWGHPSEAEGHGPTSWGFWTSIQPSPAQCESHCDWKGTDRRPHALGLGCGGGIYSVTS